MTNKKTEESSGILKYTSIGVSLASIAAGAYFFFGPKAKKHQKHAKAWVIKMKGDVIEKLESAKEVTEPIYHAIIDAVAEDYNKRVQNGQGDIAEIVTDLKKQWKTLSKALRPKTKAKAVVKKVATVVKKA